MVSATTKVPIPPDDIESWNHKQRQYWDSVSEKYDSLYEDPWARKENGHIVDEMKWLANEGVSSVLDLGCGTGLGAGFCKEIAPHIEYVGIDISKNMFQMAKNAHPEFKFHAADMADLRQFSDNTFDAVISLFSSFSHCMKPSAVLSEIKRVGKPGARILIAAMNGRSLDRIVARDTSDYDSIRMDIEDTLSAPARLYTRKSYHRMFVDAGFSDVHVTGLAIFANLMEFAPLWPVDRMLSLMFPGLCDTLMAHGTCPE